MTGLLTIIFALTAWVSAAPVDAGDTADTGSRFTTVGIYIDTADRPLAAYQLEFKATAGDIRIVGIEGGQHQAFRDPPYYDPKAIQQQRVILAAFNTSDAKQLPVGRTLVATIHLQVIGGTAPQYSLELTTAADAHAQPIPASAEYQEPTP